MPISENMLRSSGGFSPFVRISFICMFVFSVTLGVAFARTSSPQSPPVRIDGAKPGIVSQDATGAWYVRVVLKGAGPSSVSAQSVSPDIRTELKSVGNWKILDKSGSEVRIAMVRLALPFVYVSMDWNRSYGLSTIAYKDQSVNIAPPAKENLINPPVLSPLPRCSVVNTPAAGMTATSYDIKFINIIPKGTRIGIDHFQDGEIDLALHGSTRGTIDFLSAAFTNSSSLSFSGAIRYLLGSVFYYAGASVSGGISLNGSLSTPIRTPGGYFSQDVYIEVPFTNLPFIFLHNLTGYERLALPLTLELQQSEGTVNSGSVGAALGDSPATISGNSLELQMTYELAFVPFFNVKPRAAFAYSETDNTWTDSISVDVGAALGSIFPFLKRGLFPQSSNENFVFLSLGWRRVKGTWSSLPLSVGFSTVF